MENLKAVREFFREFDDVGLVLPDGWFGRPFDNLFRLTRSEMQPGLLILELEENLILSFRGDIQLERTGAKLRIDGFSEFDLDWIEFGSTASHHDRFTRGAVELVAIARS